MPEPMPAIETPPDAARSRAMAAVRSEGTKPESALLVALLEISLKPDSYNDRRLPGAPDFVFLSRRLAVFVDSAFWHGRGKTPKTNSAWWAEKLRRNRARDKKNDKLLPRLGWRVVRIDAGFAVRRPAVAALLVKAELEKQPCQN